ncbi:hypothetical protein BH11VER1_BH11VER1_05640 [soil metagenome]
MRLLTALLLIALTTCLSAVEPALQPQQDSPTGDSGKTIPFDQLGMEAQKQYSGDGIAITPTASGAQLRTVFQKLEGQATTEGLWLTSTREEDTGKAERFRVLAAEVGRHQGHLDHQFRLPGAGTVNATAESATFVRAGLTEEYRVSMDGVRQDFIVTERPAGDGALSVVLEVTGAQAAQASYGAKLTLTGSGREIAYSRLHVTDATGRELTATLEVLSSGRLAVRVDDASATYPVRIDPTFSDANWVSLNPGVPGSNSYVRAAVMDASGNLYIGGAFTFVGTVPVNHIAKWNGTAWSALGTGTGGNVHALAVSGSDLYAGGDFTTAGGVAANMVAKWDGTTWSALGTGTGGNVNALVVSGSDLYAGGGFGTAGGVTVNSIAKWNGSTWSPLGTGISGIVYALAVSGGDLYAGGSFGTAGGVTVNHIAKWNGSTWSAFGTGVPGLYTSYVYALAVIGSDLYAGGNFSVVGGVLASRIAKWDGSVWSPLGSGVSNNTSNVSVYALAVIGGELYVGGDFTSAGEGVASRIAKWNGSAWSAFGTGVNAPVRAIAGNGGDLYAGGDLGKAGEVNANYIAKWNGSAWSALGTGINRSVFAVAVSGSDLYVGGYFTSAGGVAANNIAKWNGDIWSALGTGVDNNFSGLQMDGSVHALAVLGSDLYAGGFFATAGGVATNRIAKWNGSAWSALGSGITGSGPVYINALVVSGSDVYAGGGFTSAGGVTANNIAKWNGSSWSALSTGTDGGVDALAVSGSDVYAGGGFTSAGGVAANNIAKWNGSSWSALGTGINSSGSVSVTALAVSGSNLYAGGAFTSAGGVAANNIAKWNGSIWSALGTGMNNTIKALAVSGSDLYVGGDFTAAGGASTNRIAKWNGSTWSPLGTGMDGTVYALVADTAGRLYLGGSFIFAGTTVSPYIAQANLSIPTVATSPVSNLLLSSVTLNGTVNPEGYTTTARFEYGLTSGYGSGASFVLSPSNGTSAQPVSATLSGLLPDTLYHYRLSATNAGTASTVDATFTTLTNHAPVAAAGGPYSINSGQGVTLNGSSSTDADAVYGDSIVSYQWDLDNNGTYDFTGNTIALTSSQLTTYGIGNPGPYTIKLRVTDSFGLTGTTAGGASSTLTVNTPQESWRQLYFGSTSNAGNAADNFDFDLDGHTNLMEYALGLDPKKSDTSQLPTAQKTGNDFVMSFVQPAGVSGITYGAEWSTTLLANDWHPVADSGTGGQHIFSVPVGSNTKLFMRLVVTSP